MNQREIEEAIKRYSKRLQEFGISEKALGWGEKGRANLRFEVLLSEWEFKDKRILDFGCGFGGLYDYMIKKGIQNFKYTGIDINPDFIKIAKEGDRGDAVFKQLNLFESSFEEKFDFVISSGVFNHKLENNIGFITNCFDKFDKISDKGFAVNFLSDKVSFQYDYTFHANPGAILELCYKYSNNVILKNDYMPFEYTVFVNKFSKIDEQYTVYEEFRKFI